MRALRETNGTVTGAGASDDGSSATVLLPKEPPPWMGWVMWGLVGSLYMIGFFHRLAPAVMADHLMRDFKLDGARLGTLSAIYFYSYAAMQVPSGLLADSMGPRRLSAAAAVVAATGSLVFGLAPNLATAFAGRLLIGASVAVAFVACMKLAGHWFSANRFATVTGLAILVGNLGGIMAGVPLAEGIAIVGWRPVTLASAVVTLGVASLIWMLVRDDPRALGYRSHAHVSVASVGSLPAKQALASVIAEPHTWLLFAAAGFTAGPVLVFAGLWGVPFLTQVHRFERGESALLTTVMLIAWAVGGPILGALSDRIGRRKLPYLAANLACAGLWGVFLFVDVPRNVLSPLFAALGFSSGGLVIGFAFAREVNDPRAAGAVGGVVNLSVFLVTATLQPLLGSILDRHWTGLVVGGARAYGADGFSAAFVWLFVCAALSVPAVFLTRDTAGRQRMPRAEVSETLVA